MTNYLGANADFPDFFGAPDLVTTPTQQSPVMIAVLDDDQTTRSRLAMQLGERAVPMASINELSARLGMGPVVVVLGPSCSHSDDLAGAESLIEHRPDLGAVLVADELSTPLFQRALRLGVRDVLSAPVDTAQLNQAVERVAASLTPILTRPGSHPVEAEGEGGQVVTVFSTKGGAGKSMVAVNVAVTLARRSDKPVVLVDADLQFGDIAVMLKLAPQHTIVDVVGSIDRLDTGLLQNLLARHGPSGLLVLPAPLEPAFADQIGAPQMATIIELLKTFCAYVVVDTPAYFNDVVLGLIEQSDDVLLVAGMDIPNVKNVKIGLQTLRLLNTPMSKIHLVLNRANSKVKLDVGEVERTLQIKAESLIPSDVVVPQSINKGTPVVLDAPKAAVSRSLEQLAGLFQVAEAGKRKRR